MVKMLQLHVWGNQNEISVISPESLACSWLLNMHLRPQNVPFEIVPSCNTNLSDTEVLPVLIVASEEEGKKEKYEGFERISSYISRQFPDNSRSRFIPQSKLASKQQQLIDVGLISYVETHFKYLNQYNLYINTRNYEKYTRKLFQRYFPFPMMYNQPLKFYHAAQEQVQVVGLNANKVGFFSMSGNLEEVVVPETETVNDAASDVDDGDERDEVALTTLHEKQILAKSKKKSLMRESKNSLKCLNLVNSYTKHLMELYSSLKNEQEQQEQEKQDYGCLFDKTGKLSSGELLLMAYIRCLTHRDLPDRFIHKYYSMKFANFTKFAMDVIDDMDQDLHSHASSVFRDAAGDELPNLWNEIRLTAGMVRY